ncbi:IPT/TIG domain-containing protein [uncultured Paludibaculum sp.]|uniref:IPT/TIG domain-containing protein n=1 Tax=uncultured Paludibaculum sp. TaxID=1765020 RepID=UPI002AAAAC4E|nr:IPT/TIG domain-containing protein [uncultured Paludibaculum sp.]
MLSRSTLKFLPHAVLLLVSVASTAGAQTPWLGGIYPNPVDAGGPTFTTPVLGGGFVSGAVVYWDGKPLPTTFTDSGHLQVTIASNLIALCGKFTMVVKNPNGVATNSTGIGVRPILLTVGPPVPSRLAPATVTVTGRGFVPSNVLMLSAGLAATLQTSYINSTTLTAVVPEYIAATPARAMVQVYDPPTQTFSSEELLVIGNPPTFDSMTPTGAAVDGPGLTLTVAGAGFVPGAAVRWGSTRVPTVFVNSTQLLATIDASLLRRSVVQYSPSSPISGISLFVVNPDGGLSERRVFYPREATPQISRFDPTSAFAGGPSLTLNVSGANYYSGSLVKFNGVKLATQFVNSTQLSAAVPASLLGKAMLASVEVVNGEWFMSSGVSSGSFGFLINAPTLESVSPASVTAGVTSFTLTANGTGFFSGHSILWNGSKLTTQYINPNCLSAVVDAGLVTAPGSVDIVVAGPSGATSYTAGFRIDPLPPAIGSLNPTSIAPGSPVFTLTVRGSNFIASAVVQWNGVALPTSFVGPEELTATVASDLVARSVAATITVGTSAGVSNPLPFAVTTGQPVVKSGGVGNSFSREPALAPGGLMTIYGENLAAQSASAEGYPLPMTLGGTSVTINGQAVPLLEASPAQLKVQVPFEISPGTGNLLIAVNGLQSDVTRITIQEIAPGTLAMQDSNHALAVNHPTGTQNSAQTPAHPGEYVIAYMTGQGRVDSSITTGEAAPDEPLLVPVAQLEAKVGGQPAEIASAGLVPGKAGLLQVNLKIPQIDPGERILEVSIGGVRSNSTVLSVGESQSSVSQSDAIRSGSRR